MSTTYKPEDHYEIGFSQGREEEREACAKEVESWRGGKLFLAVGEMTAQELRTVRSVTAAIARRIRSRQLDDMLEGREIPPLGAEDIGTIGYRVWGENSVGGTCGKPAVALETFDPYAEIGRLRSALQGLVNNSTRADWPDDLWDAAVQCCMYQPGAK